MDDAVTEAKQRFLRIAVAPVLFDGIFDFLLGQVVLEFEGDYGQTVDERRQVKREPSFVFRMAELPSDAEDVRGKQGFRLRVAGGRRALEQLHRRQVRA